MVTSEPLNRYVAALTDTFRRVRDKREAHYQSCRVLCDMAADPRVMTAVLQAHLGRPGTLNWKHYPVLGMEIEHNPYYTLVANCWIPLPGRETDVSTKTVHHHGNMLLTTVTAFGPGYEHWTFTRPEVVDPEQELYAMTVIERGPHPRQHVAFVDAFIGHVPLYPGSLSITLALWSNQFPTTWRDVLKRVPMFKGREETLRQLAARVGLTRALDLKVIQYFDFYPTTAGFKGMKERVEFDLGPNEDYLYSLFHVLQQTGNEALGRLVRERLQADAVQDRPLVSTLLADLESGCRVEGRLSDCHLRVPHATFRAAEIERALAASRPAAPRKA
ncbi:MAG: hypothetical protein HYS14_01865 [Candidatus Rokubacteria bacterium]|nr:hypothetical protein [Candidatus Rokubacteria bacterium]MBI3456133.1 hypothetical protein [Candidatus Rokubacteria bacterium]